MPVKRTTEAERLKAENEALSKNLQAAVVARGKLTELLKEANGDIKLRDTELAHAKDKIAALEALVAGHDARVQALDAAKGPRPDEPRKLYPAEKPIVKGVRAETLEDEKRMKAERPGYWFDNPVDAEVAWIAAEKQRREEAAKKRFVEVKTETEKDAAAAAAVTH